jgi:hypothetical protein
MRVFVEPDLLKWLSNLLCLDSSQFTYTLNAAGKCEIRSEALIEEISMGITLGDVLKTIKELNRGVLSNSQQKDNTQKLELLKKIRSSGARAYNWSILFDQMQEILDIKAEKGTFAIT